MNVADILTSPGLLIAIILIVILVMVLAIVKRYKIASPSQAFVITGRKRNEPGELAAQKVVSGSGVFLIPFVQTLSVVDLSARRINVSIKGGVSKSGVKLDVDGIAIIKIGGDEGSIRAAAQRFLNQQEEIELFATDTLSGALRSIVGTLEVEEIIRDRKAFADQVAELTESTLTGQGLYLDTFQLLDINDSDNGSYLSNLGRPEQARIAQKAAEAEAASLQASEQARIAAEGQVLTSQRALDLQQADVKAVTDAAVAAAEAAGPLSAAEKKQQVLAEQEKVAIAQAALTDRELDTTVRKPADAARYQMEQEAEGRRISAIAAAEGAKATTIAAAEAQARKDELTGQGELLRRTALAEANAVESTRQGAGERARREDLAAATKAEGEANAASVLAVGSAEAEAMQKKADAFRSYGEAAILETMLKAMPLIAKELASPMSAIDNLTVVSTEGASALPKTVVENFTQLQALVKSTTGIDLASMAKRLEDGKAGAPEVVQAVVETPAPRPRRQAPTLPE